MIGSNEMKPHMNKKILVSAPIGSGVGIVIYLGSTTGFVHLDWYRVLAVVTVSFVTVLPMAFFSRQNK